MKGIYFLNFPNTTNVATSILWESVESTLFPLFIYLVPGGTFRISINCIGHKAIFLIYMFVVQTRK